MSFLKNAALVATGYGLSELNHSHRNNKVQEQHKSLEDIIDDYAHERDIWGRDEHFYQILLKIADKYHDPYA